MSRKTILIILAIILIALGVWVYVESQKNASKSGTASSSKGLFSSLFPFGSGTAPANSGTGGTTFPTGNGTDETPSTVASRYAHISKDPTAGFIVVVPPSVTATVKTKTATGSTVSVPAVTIASIVYPTVRYAASGTGYVYDADAKGQNMRKVSGTVVARTAQALFGDNGASVILRYVKTDNQTIATYLGRVVPSTDPILAGSLSGDFIADNISDIVMSPDGKNLLYLVPTLNGVVGETMKTDRSSRKQTFASAFSEWLLDWTIAGTTLTTKAASTVPGYAYTLGGGDVMTKIISSVNGLTTKMSPDGKTVLYSVSTSTGLALHVRHLKDGTDSNTGLSTLPEKCAWNAASTTVYCGSGTTTSGTEYPDAWYQGLAHFNDSLWQIDAATGRTTQISDGEGKSLDMTHLALDSKENFLVFIDKNDGSLWSFDLNPPATPIASPALPQVQ
jgi:hypothetical protein